MRECQSITYLQSLSSDVPISETLLIIPVFYFEDEINVDIGGSGDIERNRRIVRQRTGPVAPDYGEGGRAGGAKCALGMANR